LSHKKVPISENVFFDLDLVVKNRVLNCVLLDQHNGVCCCFEPFLHCFNLIIWYGFLCFQHQRPVIVLFFRKANRLDTVVPPIAAQLETRLRRVLAGDTVEDSALRGWSDHSAVGRGEIHSFAVLRNESGALAGVLWTARDDGPGVSVSRSAPDTEKWRILMAEDLPMNQQIIAEMLESAGFEVLIVADGASAVNLVRRESIDLVLMDIEMPLMGGLEAARAIRALGAAGGVPVVAMTANQGPEQIAACRAAGMDAYICKPVDRAYLLSTVRKWLKNSRKPLPNGRTERDNVLDRGVLENMRHGTSGIQVRPVQKPPGARFHRLEHHLHDLPIRFSLR